jgi:hypothetical protein
MVTKIWRDPSKNETVMQPITAVAAKPPYNIMLTKNNIIRQKM